MSDAPPHTASQCEQILTYLMVEGNELSHITAMDKFGCACLAERARDLRKKGHPIVTEIRKMDNNKRVGFYKYVPSEPQQTRLGL